MKVSATVTAVHSEEHHTGAVTKMVDGKLEVVTPPGKRQRTRIQAHRSDEQVPSLKFEYSSLDEAAADFKVGDRIEIAISRAK